MRKYEPIWNKLKDKGTAYLTAPEVLHARIIKAVTKEKYNDDLFRFDCSQASKKAKLVVQTNGSIIRFDIIYSIGVDDL